MSSPHVSVLLTEVLHHFQESSLSFFVDGTLGAGGHSFAILQEHPEIELLIGIDQDPLAREIGAERLSPWKNKIKIVEGNFSQLDFFLNNLGIKKVDGILLDLGVSSMQFDIAEKGFSFMRDGPLDMRMNPKEELTAHEVVNTWTEHQLGRIFRDYGEEKQWRQAAKTIVAARNEKPINTTLELAQVLNPLFSWKKKGINPLTLIFQALRICVNRELEVLELVLQQAILRLNKGGRLAVISFHSLEDRIVKNILRFAASDKYDTSGIGGLFLDKEPVVKLITRKPICASNEEINVNPRSRSAKLRVIEKL
jgi:16S rRNA (cytosine1402-N4)-methyltransferase